ncbi:hypothetical protein IV203_028982 [Nitzschia inconspicua]|uniref:Uncharacterized protein n=1 Tax=Nitzschia inconspicua TaxID=303405 RepID=A0A9K3PZY9_9STRA|nr:hypothetical protein IV203_028982 [Nitzschia inconspicua]
MPFAYDELFSGKIGHYTKRKFHIDIVEDATPFHCKQPYPVPLVDRETVKAELERQVDLGLLERVYESEWGMPMFATKKSDGSIRTVDDLRQLNKVIRESTIRYRKSEISLNDARDIAF